MRDAEQLLELENLLLGISQILKHPAQFALILRTGFGPADRIAQPRRSAHEDLDVLALRVRKDLLQ